MNYSTGGGSIDGVIVVFSRDGMALEYSTYLNGSGSDGCYGVSLDSHGNAYVVGETEGGLPVTYSNGLYFDDTYNGGGSFPGQPGDGFILRLNAGSLAMSWLTYYGGVGTDALWGVDAYGDQRIAVVGFHGAVNYPLFNPGGASWYQSAISGIASVVAELITPDGPIGISETSASTIIIGPNPAHDWVRIIGARNNPILTIDLLDLAGRAIGGEVHNANGMFEVNVSSVPTGCYILRIIRLDGNVINEKLMVEHE